MAHTCIEVLQLSPWVLKCQYINFRDFQINVLKYLEAGGAGGGDYRIAGNIQSSSRWNSSGHQLVLKPLKPLFKTEDTLMGSRYELEPRAAEQ